jgi:RNA polymerase sigma-70 factor (ECF subfamily)
VKAVPLFDETEVLRLIADGDQRAFTMLFRQYSKKVYSFALRLLKSEGQAEEVVQEVFLRIWLNRGSLSEIENFPAYLNRMSRNHCLNAIKRLTQEQKASLEIANTSTELSHETEEGIAFRGAQELIEQAVSKLSPQQQKVYRLCHVDGLKYEEAAAELNISPGTVHTHMKLALKAIRQHLDHAGAAMMVAALMEQFLK